MVFWSCLLLLFLWLRVSLANLWTIEVPTSVLGLSGSCVVIPCTFSYPAQGKTYKTFTGIWYTGNYEAVYHSDTLKIIDAFKGRTNLIGDLHQNNCSLKISSLRSSDAGLLKFRIEIKDLDKYTYENQKVSLKVEETPVQPTISVEEKLTSGKPVNVTCTVSYFCPSDLPTITWSHNGIRSSPSQTQTHTLTFTPSREDHNKKITCSAAFKEKKVTAYKTLKVKYPPYNVTVVSESSVKEYDSVKMTCSSDSNPPADYQWISQNGTVLGRGSTYDLVKVSRRTMAISCTAINTEGQNTSDPHNIKILYPPDITNNSSCQSASSTVCVCFVDSNPPSEVKWFGPDSSKSIPSSSINITEFLSIITLQGWVGLPETIQCFANNSLGNSSLTLEVPQNAMLYIYASVASAIVAVLAGIVICVVRRHRVNRATQQPAISMKNEMKTTLDKPDFKNKEVKDGDEDIYTNCPSGLVYDNWGCNQKPPSSVSALEDEQIYANA